LTEIIVSMVCPSNGFVNTVEAEHGAAIGGRGEDSLRLQPRRPYCPPLQPPRPETVVDYKRSGTRLQTENKKTRPDIHSETRRAATRTSRIRRNAEKEPPYCNHCKMSKPEGLPEMEYRFLGRSGLKVSAISLGGWLTYGGHVDRGELRRL
jgi:hypothetical protein